MAGRRGFRTWAVGIVLALVTGAFPASAAPAPTISVVPGRAMTTTLSASPSGTQRTVTLPGIAALRFATTPAQVRAALRQHLQSLGSEPATPEADDRPALDGVFPVGDLDGDRRADLV